MFVGYLAALLPFLDHTEKSVFHILVIFLNHVAHFLVVQGYLYLGIYNKAAFLAFIVQQVIGNKFQQGFYGFLCRFATFNNRYKLAGIGALVALQRFNKQRMLVAVGIVQTGSADA